MGVFSELQILSSDVLESFYSNYNSNKKISRLFQKVRDGTATYAQANEYAIEIGNILAKAYKANIPIKTMVYDEALSLLDDPLTNNYDLISSYCESVQNIMNKKNKMNVNALKPKQNRDRIDGLAKAISEAEDENVAIKYFGEQIINYSQSVVDDAIHDNAGFFSDLGFSPQIIREYEGPHNERGHMVDCEYCKELAGTYDYEDVRSSGSDVYKRHEGCRCTLTYIPNKGTTSRMRTSGNAFVRY